jgi:hypothetical protein
MDNRIKNKFQVLKMNKILLVTGVVLVGLTVPLLAGQGSAGAQFLQIFGGTHGTALAGAFTAYPGSPQSLYWNPACIREVPQIALNFTHSEYLVGIKYENFALVIPLGQGTLGIHGIGLLSGEIEETTVLESEGTGNTFTANDYAAGLSFARALTNKFDAGVTLKVVNQNLGSVSATSWAFDLGALYKTGLFANMRIGFSIRNFGPDMHYSGEALEGFLPRSEVVGADEDVKYELVSEEYSLPMSFHLGVMMEHGISTNSKLVLNIDATNSVDQRETLIAALEWQMPDWFYIAMGHANAVALFKTGASDEDLGGNMRGLTFGAGFNFGKFTGNPFWVEYAWESHKYLNPIHRFGIELDF